MSLADVRSRLSDVVDRVERQHNRVVITKHGRPAAVVVSVDDLESLEETLQILSDPDLLARVRAAHDEVARGEVDVLDRAELLAELGIGHDT